MTSPAEKLEFLCNRAEIADLLALYCERIDEYDIPAVAELFTPYCEADYGPGRGGLLHGRDTVCERIARGQAEFRRTHHQLGQSRVELEGANAARAITYVTAWHEHHSGERSCVRLRYVDRLKRTADGWRIAYRRAEVCGVQGEELESLRWIWVRRRRPQR